MNIGQVGRAPQVSSPWHRDSSSHSALTGAAAGHNEPLMSIASRIMSRLTAGRDRPAIMSFSATMASEDAKEEVDMSNAEVDRPLSDAGPPADNTDAGEDAGAPRPETAQEGDDSSLADLMDLFTEDDETNVDLRRMASDLDDVDVRDLVDQAQELDALLKKRRFRTDR